MLHTTHLVWCLSEPVAAVMTVGCVFLFPSIFSAFSFFAWVHSRGNGRGGGARGGWHGCCIPLCVYVCDICFLYFCMCPRYKYIPGTYFQLAFGAWYAPGTSERTPSIVLDVSTAGLVGNGGGGSSCCGGGGAASPPTYPPRKAYRFMRDENPHTHTQSALCRRLLLRGGIVNRTYGIHKKPIYLTFFTNNIWSY